MPPKPRFTAERILDAAFALTRDAGIGAVSARSVAAALGSSTGPVTSHFATMDALHEQLMERIIADFVARVRAGDHRDPLIAAGVAWLRFAADEPLLYEAAFLRRHPWPQKWGPVRKRMAARMAMHPTYAGLSGRVRFALVGRTSIIMHGIGLEIWAGRLPSDDLPRLITELVAPVVQAALDHGWTDDLHSPAPNT